MDCVVLENIIKGIEIYYLLGLLVVRGGGKKGKGIEEKNTISCYLDY